MTAFTISACESPSVEAPSHAASTSVVRGMRVARQRRAKASRHGPSGSVKATCARIRRWNAWSWCATRFVANTTTPSKRSRAWSMALRVALSACSEPCCTDATRRPRMESASSKKSIAPSRCACSKTAFTFFSDSPMYRDSMSPLPTTRRGTPRCAAIASAARVLPVPGGPWKLIVRRARPRSRAPSPQRCVRCGDGRDAPGPRRVAAPLTQGTRGRRGAPRLRSCDREPRSPRGKPEARWPSGARAGGTRCGFRQRCPCRSPLHGELVAHVNLGHATMTQSSANV